MELITQPPDSRLGSVRMEMAVCGSADYLLVLTLLWFGRKSMLLIGSAQLRYNDKDYINSVIPPVNGAIGAIVQCPNKKKVRGRSEANYDHDSDCRSQSVHMNVIELDDIYPLDSVLVFLQ